MIKQVKWLAMLGRSMQRFEMAILTMLALVVVVGMMHDIMFQSGFDRIQSSPHDSRFNHFVLEHEYLWMRADTLHPNLWDLPMFYPAGANSLAYSDTLLSFQAPYALARYAGLNPGSSYQTWLLAIAVINILASLYFFRCVIGASPIAATVGAVLFCVAAPRFAQADHHQLYPQIWLLLLATALIRMFRDGMRKNGSRISMWPSIAALAIALQLWGGFYLAFFALFAVAVGVGFGLLIPSCRSMMWTTLRRLWPSILLAGALLALLIAPLAMHYGGAMGDVGGRAYPDVKSLLPRPQSWFYAGGGNIFWGWTDQMACFHNLPNRGEHVMGQGFLTVVAALAGLWLYRRNPIARWLFITTTAIVVLTTNVAGHSLWRHIYAYFPAADAIRAVSRIWLITILPTSLAVAALITRLERNGHLIPALLIGLLCVIEQDGNTVGYDRTEIDAKTDALASVIPPGTEAFFVSASDAAWCKRPSIDAMWTALSAGCPTINGYSGNDPCDYQLITLPENRDQLMTAEGNLYLWCLKNGLDSENIVWIHDGQIRPFGNVTTGHFSRGAEDFSAWADVGFLTDQQWSTDAREGFLFFGPYKFLLQGAYTLILKGRVIHVEDAVLDVFSNRSGGSQEKWQLRALSSPAYDDTIARLPVDLKQDVSDLEIRLFVGTNDHVLIKGYEIELRSDSGLLLKE
jgi:hypothetical protein